MRSSISSDRTRTSRSTPGEAFGLPSIWQALQWCGAERLGHGVRIADDIEHGGDEPVLGRLASYVRDRRVPLEMCPSSNLQTGAASSVSEHPIGLLAELRFRVTVNTDNRLMSATSMSREMELLASAFGYDLDVVRWFTINALKSAFLPFDERLDLIERVVKPGYLMLVRQAGSGQSPEDVEDSEADSCSCLALLLGSCHKWSGTARGL